MQDDQAYSELWHSQNSLFKHFQGYLGIFKDIDAYSATLTGAELEGNKGAPQTFFENRKKCPDFGKMFPDLWVKFSIQNVVLRVSRTKKFKIFHCGGFFSYVFDEMFIKVP